MTNVTEQVVLYPASPAQERMWFSHESRPEDRAYNVFLAFRVRGPLDMDILRTALQDVVSAHEPLRTRFRRSGGELFQLVSESAEVALTVHPDEGCPPEVGVSRLTELATAPFDLERGPLFRVDLLPYGRDLALLVSMHHIVTDGRSLDIICRDIAEAYRSRRDGSAPHRDDTAPQYGDYCEMLAEMAVDDRATGHLAYWRRLLSPPPAPLRLPLDKLRPAVQHPAADRIHVVSAALGRADLEQAARGLAVPPSGLAFTALHLVLATWTGQRDHVIGMPTSGRVDPAVEDLVGLFVNTVPTRIDTTGLLSRDEVVHAVTDRMTEALDRQDTPLDDIVEAVAPPRSPGRDPLFDVLFTVQNTSGVALALPDAVVTEIDVDSSWTRHDLELNVWLDRERPEFLLVSRTSLFDPGTTTAIAEALDRTLTALADPDVELPALLEAARPGIPVPPAPTATQLGAATRIRQLPGVTEVAVVRAVDSDASPCSVALVAAASPVDEGRVLSAAGVGSGIDGVALVDSLPVDASGRLEPGRVEAVVVSAEVLDRWRAAAPEGGEVSVTDSPVARPADETPPPSARPTTDACRAAVTPPPSLATGGPAPELPHRDLGGALRRAARTGHGITVVDDRGRTQWLGYDRLHDEAILVAAELTRVSVPGTPVILAYRDNRWLLPRLWGCLLAGLPVMPWIPPLLHEDAVAGVADITAVVPDGRFLADPGLADLLGRFVRDTGGTLLQDIDITGTAGGAGQATVPLTDADALLLRTSGSTRRPKAVRVTHRQILTRSAGAALACGLTPDDISLNWMPLDHVGGVVMFHIRDVVLGLEQVQVSTQHVLGEPSRWMRLCSEHRVTTTWAPNFAFGLVADAVHDLTEPPVDLSRLRHILNGGEAVRRQTVLAFLRATAPLGLPADAVRPSWGMSETSSGQTDSPHCTAAELELGSGAVPVGRPYPGFSIRVVDASGSPVPQGSEGRLQVRGPGVTPGYHRDAVNTDEAFTADGWFDTGDLAVLVRDELTIVGRAKDTVIINGRNFTCEEIEVVVEQHCAVQPSCTAALELPTEDADSGRVTVATTPADGIHHDELEALASGVREACRQVTGHPADVVFLSAGDIPRSGIGKILRPRLCQQLVDSAVPYRLFPGPSAGPADSVPDGWLFVPRALSAPDGHPTRNPAVSAPATARTACLLGPVDPQLVTEFEGLGVRARTGGPLRSGGCSPAPTEDLVVLASEPVGPGVPAPVRLVRTVGDLAVALSDSSTPAPGQPGRELVVLHRGAASDPVHGLLVGLTRSLDGELPGLRIRLVHAPDASAAEIADELVHGLGPVTVHGTGHTRHRVRERLAPCPTTRHPGRLPRLGGVFVLTGGAGALGTSLARYLLAERDATVLLLGRTAHDDTAGLSSWFGPDRVHTARVDVTDARALGRAVREFEAVAGAQVDGAFHLAGGFAEAPFAQTTDTALHEALDAKVIGAHNLVGLMSERPGSEVVFCSSVGGQLGSPFAAAYSAASSYLDLTARYGDPVPVRCRSIAWSMWLDTGLSSGVGHADRATRRGTLVLDPARAEAAWPRVLASDEPVVLVGLDENRPLIRSLVGQGGRGHRALEVDCAPELVGAVTDLLGGRVSVRRRQQPGAAARGGGRPASSAPTGRRGEVEQVISSLWREVLSLPSVDRDANFFDLGGTSIHLSRIHERIRSEVDPELTLQTLFRLNTVAELAAHIARPGPDPTGPGAAPDSAVSRAADRGLRRSARQRRRTR